MRDRQVPSPSTLGRPHRDARPRCRQRAWRRRLRSPDAPSALRTTPGSQRPMRQLSMRRLPIDARTGLWARSRVHRTQRAYLVESGCTPGRVAAGGTERAPAQRRQLEHSECSAHHGAAAAPRPCATKASCPAAQTLHSPAPVGSTTTSPTAPKPSTAQPARRGSWDSGAGPSIPEDASRPTHSKDPRPPVRLTRPSP